jgi:hypothetical protein
MKRKVKKFAEGGTNVRTRTDEEFAEDSKFGGYGKYMPKTKSYSMDDVKSGLGRLLGGKSSPSEDRPTSSGVEDYASMGKRAPAKSTWSGTPDIKEETTTETETESPKGIASGFKSSESKFERNDNEVKMPSAKPKQKRKSSDIVTAKNLGSQDAGFNVKPKKGYGFEENISDKSTSKMEEKTPETPAKNEGKKYGIGPHGAFASIHKLFSDDRTEEQKQTHADAMMKAYKGKKSGGSIKKMASGGKVSSASSRGDGIAQRGKTKGRIC